jgi:hypothetical protein
VEGGGLVGLGVLDGGGVVCAEAGLLSDLLIGSHK